MVDYVTVSQINAYIKYKIDNDKHLKRVYLKGELSNVKEDFKGHYYLTVKDENSRISGVMFASHAKSLDKPLKDGMNVLIEGYISVFERNGNYQLYIEKIEEDGIGKLYIEFEKLKKKLEQEGLFDIKYKKEIPKYPETIGIITAPTGAAIKDILSTIKRRWPFVKTILFPSLVQGELAKDDLVRNINLTKEYNLDVLIIGRGGGSLEDLWPFNEEVVARALFDLEVPTISAVGHEVDFSICDFVADLRAPTPTGAAEMAVPDIEEVNKHFKHLKARSINSILNIKKSREERLINIKTRPIMKNPYIYLNKLEEIVSFNRERFIRFSQNYLSKQKEILNTLKTSKVLIRPDVLINMKKDEFKDMVTRLKEVTVKTKHNYEKSISLYIGKLEALDPLKILKRGYSVVRSDSVIKSIKEVKADDLINIEVNDGYIEGIVKSVKEKK